MLQQPKETTVRITRPFCMGGEPVPADTVLVLETPFALELVAMNKAVVTKDAPRAPQRETSTRAPRKPRQTQAEKLPADAANENQQAPQGPDNEE